MREVAPGAGGVSVIIPLRNRPIVLEVLETLARQCTRAELSEVIVIDVESTDETQAQARGRNYPFELRWEMRPFDGVFNRSRVRNWGIEIARGDVALFLDADVLAGPELVREHSVRRSLADRPRATVGYVYGASMIDPWSRTPETLQPPAPQELVTNVQALARHRPAWRDQRDGALAAWPTLADCPFPWNFWWTNNAACSLAALRSVGGFDETMGERWGFEDVELAYRLFRSGVEFSSARSAWGAHYPHAVSADLEAAALTNGRYFVRKHPDAMVELACWSFFAALRSPDPTTDELRARGQLLAILEAPPVMRTMDAALAGPLLQGLRRERPVGPIGWFGELPDGLELAHDVCVHSRPFASREESNILGLFTGLDDKAFGTIVASDYWRWLPAELFPHLLGELTRIAEVVVLVKSPTSSDEPRPPLPDLHGAARALETTTIEPRFELSRRAFRGCEALVVMRGRGRDLTDARSRSEGDEGRPLSHAQERLWISHQLEPGSVVPQAFAHRLRGPLHVEALRHAFEDLVDRHHVLRTVFRSAGAELYQVVRPAMRWELAVEQQRGLDEHALEGLVTEEAQRSFDLAAGPLLRTRLVCVDDGEHVVIVTLHPIVCDEVSMGILWRELSELYAAHARGTPATLSSLPLQVADHAVWQRSWLAGGEAERELGYWKQQLLGASADIALPSRARPGVCSGGRAQVAIAVNSEDSRRLRDLAEREGVTVATTLVAAFRALLFRYTGQDDLSIGTLIANRKRPETAGLIGPFANTLVLRNQVASDESFCALLAREHAILVAAHAHEQMPFDLVVAALGLSRSENGTPLCKLLYTHRAHDDVSGGLAGLTVEPLNTPVASSPFDLIVTSWEDRDRLGVSFVYNEDLYERSRVEQLARHFVTNLHHLSREPNRRIADAQLLDRNERRRAEVTWNDTERTLDVATVPALIEAQVDRTPDAVALVFETASVTYRELDARANQLAHHLRALGARAEVPVAVMLERSVELVVTLLAILKTGAPYLPIDPGYPPARVRTILADSGAPLLVGDARGRADLEDCNTRVVRFGADEPTIAACPLSRPAVEILPGSLAYIIYTSGSTGRPKGAMNTHAGLHNRLACMQSELALHDDDVVLQKTPYTFDVSVWEFFWPLMTGARLVLARPDAHRDAAELATLMVREQVTTLHFVPSMLEIFLEQGGARAWKYVRRVVCSGEALAPSHQARLFAVSNAELINLYGPTEAAIDVSIWRCRRDDAPGATIPIGRPVSNSTLYVVDATMQLVPLGVPGELVIGGVQLARGYLGRPDLTAERFVPDPFGPPGSRVYRTGDLARRRDDGNLEYLGRLDHQVKLRGFRIELGEIESVLAEHPTVRQAAVIVRDSARGTELVAYVVPGEGFDRSAARARLADKVPAYMVPAAVVTLDAFPLTSSGKLDRKKLPVPDEAAFSRDEYVAPRTPDEETLAAIWSELLGVEQVGARDDFFALGGQSLLAIRLVAEIERAFGVRIPLRQIFLGPTVSELVAEIQRRRSGHEGAAARPQLVPTGARRARLPAPQRGTYRLEQDSPGNRLNRSVWSAWLDGPLNTHALERALAAMRQRHGILRIRFFEEGGELWEEVVDPADLPSPLIERVEVSSRSGPELDRVTIELHERFMQQPLDLAAGQVMRVALVVASPTRHRITLCLHRLACDDESLRVFVDELAQLWRAFTEDEGRDVTEVLGAPLLQYVDLADYLSRLSGSAAGESQRTYWKARLAGATPLELPTDLPREPVDARRDEKAGFVIFPTGFVSAKISTELLTAVEGLAYNARVSVQSTLMAAMAAYLSSLTGQVDLAMISHLVYRHLPGLDRSLGLFGNPLVMRVSAAGSPTFRELVARTHEVVTSAFEHGECDVLGLASPRMFRLWFNYLYFIPGSDTRELPLPAGLSATPASPPIKDPKMAYDLLLFLRNEGDRVTLDLAYNRELFYEAGASAFLGGYVDRLGALCRDPDSPISPR